MSSEAEVQAAIESVVAKHARLDVLVNCAGIVGALLTDANVLGERLCCVCFI